MSSAMHLVTYLLLHMHVLEANREGQIHRLAVDEADSSQRRAPHHIQGVQAADIRVSAFSTPDLLMQLIKLIGEICRLPHETCIRPFLQFFQERIVLQTLIIRNSCEFLSTHQIGTIYN